MEPITLCGLVIVMFGLWVEFEPVVQALAKMIRKSQSYVEFFSNPAARKPVYVRKLPICLAKAFH
jgi:hypothetical protein